MTSRLRIAAIIFALFSCMAPARAVDPKTPKKSDAAKTPEGLNFIRVVRDKHDQPLALETATGHYVPANQAGTRAKSFSVDLIGCIHIADKKYYDDLNERFKQYDAVLFELVMPDGQSLEGLGNRESNHPIGRIQQSLPKVLNLAYQLKEIDYTPSNFVHADLSPDEIAKAMKSRGDTATSVVFKVLFDVFKESSRMAADRAKKGDDFAELQLLAAIFDPNRPLALKKIMADQMEILGTGSGLGATLETMLIQDRNDAAMKVLSREIEKGTRKIAIFYGAAHMTDFDRRLTGALKLKRESIVWNRAWDLSGK
jgi:hypothetical protein